MNKIDYFYKNKDGSYQLVEGENKAWELSTCIDKFPAIQKGVKKNLDLFIALRNKIEHRYCPAFDLEVIGECHALLMNFEDFLIEYFSTYYSLQSSLVIPLQLIKAKEKDIIKSLRSIEREHYDELKAFIYSFRETLTEETLNDSSFCFRLFLIPNIGNHATSADASIQFVNEKDLTEAEKEVLSHMAMIHKTKKMSVINPGCLKPGRVVSQVKLKTNKKFNMNMHTKARKLYDIRPDPQNCKIEYCQYDDPHGDYIYTEGWVDFLVQKIQDEEEYERIKNFK